MTNLILLSLCVAAEGFLFFCLFHFAEELKQMSRQESDVGQWMALANAPAMPVQSHESTSIAVRREVAWNVVSFRMDDSKSRTVKGKNEEKQNLKIAA
jgi:hypothetical protein